MDKPVSVEAYLAALPAPRRAVLDQLRETIRAAAPDAVESIAYDMPSFRSNGRFVVSYAAFKHHYSLFPASDAVMAVLGDALRPHLAGRATIRFTDADPLSPEVVTRLVAIRLAETAANDGD